MSNGRRIMITDPEGNFIYIQFRRRTGDDAIANLAELLNRYSDAAVTE